MVEKDRSVILNKTYLLQMLPSLYQSYLENQLDRPELLFLSLLSNVLQDLKEISLEKLATALPLPILFESRRKKIQRFLSLPTFTVEKLWLPLIKSWLDRDFVENQTIYVAIDRTNWARINLLMISVIYDRRAIPVYFELLPKLGSSNLSEQKNALLQILPIFNKYQTIVLGDREFCSVNLANWLKDQNLYFCVRLKKSEFVEVENEIWQTLSELGLKPGISLFLTGIKLTKTSKISGFNLACKWQQTRHGWSPEEGWFILTNLADLKAAIAAYKKRFDIEEMFRDFKTGGDNLEDTNVSANRLISLLIVIALAYSLATFKGQNFKKKAVQKYVGRVKEYGRIQRRHSSFYIGLYGQTWVKFMESSWEIVTELMRLNRNKLEYYLRGMRAMELIASAS